MDRLGIMIFLAADNDLNPYARLNDLREIRRAQGAGNAVPLCVQFHSPQQEADDTPVLSVAFRQGEEVACLRSEQALNTGNAAVLSDFMDWSMSVMPCERYSLIVWGHGSGAVDAESMAELTAETVKSVAYDYTDGDALTTAELAQALGSVLGDRRLDVLGFDACHMGSAEVMAELARFCGVYVGSETVIPPVGWPYDLVLDDMAALVDSPASDAAAAVCRRYGQRTSASKSVCLSAVDTDRMERVLEAVRAMVEGCVQHMHDPAAFCALYRAARQCLRFGDHFVDLGDFARCLAGQQLPAGLSARADAVFRAVSDAVFHLTQHNLQQATGMAAVFPFNPLSETLARRYAGLRFARETGWNELLDAFHRG
jgi:hypothetical protein